MAAPKDAVGLPPGELFVGLGRSTIAVLSTSLGFSLGLSMLSVINSTDIKMVLS